MKFPRTSQFVIAGTVPIVLFIGCQGTQQQQQEGTSSVLPLGATTTVRTPGGDTTTRTFDVERGKRYGIAVAVDTSTSFQQPVYALEISGDPLSDPLTIRSDQFVGDITLQTFGLPLDPDTVFTAESNGTVTVSFTNATQSSLPSVFDVFAIFGGESPTDTTLQYEILIEEITE